MKRILLLLFVLSVTSVYAQEPSLSAQGKRIELSLEEISEQALNNNLDIQMIKLDMYIERHKLDISQSVFDTFFTFYGSHTEDRLDVPTAILGTRSTTRSFGGEIKKKLPTGTEVTLDTHHTKDYTNSSFATLNPAHEATAKISLRQPLMRNFFGMRDRGEIKIVRDDIENFEWASLTGIETSLAGVQEAYWRLVLAQEEFAIRRGMLVRAEGLLHTYRDKLTKGLAEEPDVIAAQVNVKTRESEILVAELAARQAQNALLFQINVEDLRSIVVPTDSLVVETSLSDLYTSLKTAVTRRRDYQRAINLIAQNRINLSIKKNALWPQVDLEASFARNGIDTDPGKAWAEFNSEKHAELFFGVTITTSLERRKENAELSQAKLEKEKYLLFLKQIEHRIFSEINDAAAAVNSRALIARTAIEVLSLQEAKLSAEDERLRYGRSSIDTIVRYQDDVLAAKLAQVYALYNYRVAVIELKAAQHTLLDEYLDSAL